jgi:hypothetical protein
MMIVVLAAGILLLAIKVSFVRAAGVLAKCRMWPAGRMFDMPDVGDLHSRFAKFTWVDGGIFEH